MAAPGGGDGSGDGSPGGLGADQSYLPPGLQWEEVSTPLKEFASKHPVPNVVRVTKGQYRNIGVAKSVTSELYLHSIKTSKKVLAEGVKVKEGKRITTVDQKFSLPVTYQGWFELLSEDGKAIKPVQSVQELARVFPQRCLVRESIKVNLTNRDTGEVSADRTRLLATGEQLSLVGDVIVPSGSSTSAPGGGVGGVKGQANRNRKYLKCFDQQGEGVFISFDQKGMFSPIAGTGNISGVHNIKGLLEKFRLPIMVRLVHGIIPSRLDKSSFTGVFRLLSVYSDETAFVCPMGRSRDAKMVPVSTREPLKLTPTLNFSELEDQEEVRFYHMRCGKMIASYLNSIHVLVGPPDPALLSGAAGAGAVGGMGRGGRGEESFHRQGQQGEAVIQTSPAGMQKSARATIRSPGGMVGMEDGNSSRTATTNGVTEEDILFDEIDDIYQFVRDGGRPPPPRPRPPHLRKSDPTPISPPSTNGTSSEQRPLSQGNNNISKNNKNNVQPNNTNNNMKTKRSGSKGEVLPSSQRPGVATAIISRTGSVDILNSSASGSPEDTSPATTLSYPRHQGADDNYWEEPVYEEVNKYRKAAAAALRKEQAGKGGGGGGGAMGPGGARVSVGARGAGGGAAATRVGDLRSGVPDGMGGAVSSPTASPRDHLGHRDQQGPPVENLRQMYKLHTGSRKSYADPTDEGSCGEDLEVGGPMTSSPGHHHPGRLHESEGKVGAPGGAGPSTAEEFKTVYDRIASINRANNMSTTALVGGRSMGGGATTPTRRPSQDNTPQQQPQQQPGIVRRYVRANNPTTAAANTASGNHGNAGRSYGNNQFMAVARVGPGGTSTIRGSQRRGSNSGIGGVPTSSASSSSQKGVSSYHPHPGGPAPSPGPTPSRDKPERHSERSPKGGAYSRVENLRRKLQGLYL